MTDPIVHYAAAAVDPTPLQAQYLDIANTALVVGTVSACFIVFLLAVIAVRGLASWK